MKKIYVFAMALICQIVFSQQITLSRLGGAVIENGSIIAMNQTGYPNGEVGFKVRNTGTTTTNVWVRCQNLVNNDGSDFEFCFGEECLASMILGQVYPSVGVVLAPNATNGNYDHFLNNNTGTGTYPMDFVFKFFQTNQSTQGGAEVGNSIIVTYRYDPTLSVDEVSQLETAGAIIKSTIVKNELVLDVLKNVTVSVFDLNGKVIQNQQLGYGVHSINASNWSNGVYIVNLTSDEGKVSSKKIVKE